MNDTIESCRVTGEIALDGANIYDKSIDEVPLRAQVGTVFQKPNLFPKSIYDNIAYGPKIHGLAENKAGLDDIVETSLKKAGLWDEVSDSLDHPGTGLSGGQQQRLCIARTNAVSPNMTGLGKTQFLPSYIAKAIYNFRRGLLYITHLYVRGNLI